VYKLILEAGLEFLSPNWTPPSEASLGLGGFSNLSITLTTTPNDMHLKTAGYTQQDIPGKTEN